MGSWISHLRVAETLLAHLNGLDQTAFTFGSLAPDSGIPNADWTSFNPPKELTHFIPEGSSENNVRDFLFYRQYIQPVDRSQDIFTSSFRLGYFFHLVCDRLWSEKIGKSSLEAYPELFAAHTEVEAWNIIKEDWYGLDQRYVRGHPDCLTWKLFSTSEIPQVPLPFIEQSAFEHQVNYIREFYGKPSPKWNLDRLYPYLNEAAMQRYVDESAASLLKINRLLSACPPPDRLDSATMLLTSAETAPFPVPLGD
jgi:hypothetical protein